MTFTLTDEQAAIVAAVARRSGSVMAEAGAGCAKTSTIKAASPGVKVPGLALAFNRRIADDMAKAVPGNITTKTMNGLGHVAWARAVGGGVSLRLDDRKLSKLVTQVFKDHKLAKESADDDRWDCVRSLTRAAMASGLVPTGSGPEGLVPDSPEQWTELGEEIGVAREDIPAMGELARKVLIQNIVQARLGAISFDDQVYCSTMLGGRFTRYPVVLVDEDQDLSPLNIRMLGQSLAPGGRIIAVGDKRQAIYAWRGASGRSAELIRELVPAGEWADLPLMTTFRCPKAVVARQQAHVPGFRAFEGNPEGRVVGWPIAVEADGSHGGWGWAEIASALPSPRASLAVLCRNNAPLVRLAIKLIRQGIGVVMLGRDIAKGLQQLASKLAADDGVPIGMLLGALRDWVDRESGLVGDYRRKLESIHDRAECLEACAAADGVRTVGDLKRAIRTLFDRESGLVTLSSIHRAKGLEWDCVVHLDPWRIARAAKRARAVGDLVQVEQEGNLRYVAETRTRHTLVLASLEDFRDG